MNIERIGSPREEDSPLVPIEVIRLLDRRPAEQSLREQAESRDELPPITDIANARRFRNIALDRLLWVPAWKQWRRYERGRWVEDTGALVAMQIACQIPRQIFSEAAQIGDERARAALAKWGLQSANLDRLRATVELAKSVPDMSAEPVEFDTDPWSLACLSGVVDLRTGELRSHSPEARITRWVAIHYDPATTCPRWERFLFEVFAGDTCMIAHIQRVIGYGLTGCVTEQVFWVLWGSGANGKSIIAEVLRLLFGDYYHRADPQLFVSSFSSSRPGDASPHFAGLKAARLVIASETPPNARLAETSLKELTGGDAVTGRFLYCDPFTFQPSHKLILLTNHRPRVSQDRAVWRRMRLVPFAVTFPPESQDKGLLEKLRAELPGILAWAVKGAIAWAANGLQEPPSVQAATKEYRTSEDVVGRFVEECCTLEKGAVTHYGELYRAFEAWCRENGEPEYGSPRFSSELDSRGIESRKGGKGVRCRIGIKLGGASFPCGLSELLGSREQSAVDAAKHVIPRILSQERIAIDEARRAVGSALTDERFLAALTVLHAKGLVQTLESDPGMLHVHRGIRG
ncbi:hypothetical protein GC173_16550 [bacterium]|nr:hypothetical protein [bacterium]